MLLGFPTRHGFTGRPTYRALAARLSPDELLAELAKPAVKAQILAEDDVPPDPTVLFDGFFQLVQGVARPAVRARRPAGVRAHAGHDDRGDGRRPRASTRSRCSTTSCSSTTAQHLLMLPFFNYAERNHDAIREMLLHPGGVSGLSDGGAHCGLICDASIPTFMLTHWARDRVRGDTLPLEYLVKKQTSDTAALYGLGDRGVLAPGKKADVNVIDFDGLTLRMPRVADDLPAGGARLLQEADGYVATIVSGEVTRRHGVDTGARPGRLLRGAR